MKTFWEFKNKVWLNKEKNIDYNLNKLYDAFWLEHLKYQKFFIKKFLAIRISSLFFWKIFKKIYNM